jgi:hypothetical protein
MMQNYLHLLNLKSLKINLVDSLAMFVINGIVLYVYRHTRCSTTTETAITTIAAVHSLTSAEIGLGRPGKKGDKG